MSLSVVESEMFRIGIKMGPARNKEWTCMFGMHVRTATIIIGLWHLVIFHIRWTTGKLDLTLSNISVVKCNGAGSVGHYNPESGNDTQSGARWI